MSRKLVVLIAGLALALAVFSIWRVMHPSFPKVDRAPMIGSASGIGFVLAEETARIVPPSGKIVLVTDHDHDRGDRPLDYRWQTFLEELKKRGSFTIVATEIVAPDPAEGMPGCSSDRFVEIVRRHAEVDAIIFFIDLPEWLRVNWQVPQHSAKILAVDTQGSQLRARYHGYLSSGTASVVIGSNGAGDTGRPEKPQTPREWFDRFFQVYTPKSMDTLPD